MANNEDEEESEKCYECESGSSVRSDDGELEECEVCTRSFHDAHFCRSGFVCDRRALCHECIIKHRLGDFDAIDDPCYRVYWTCDQCTINNILSKRRKIVN